VLLETENMYKAIDKITESKNGQEPFQQPLNRSSMPRVAGILLIISGIIAFIFWVPAIVQPDTYMSMMNMSQIQEAYPDMSVEQFKDLFVFCSTIPVVLAIFPILGGILSLKKKLRGLALVGGILGIFTLGFLVVSPILSIIGIILIVMSKKEFQ